VAGEHPFESRKFHQVDPESPDHRSPSPGRASGGTIAQCRNLFLTAT
jgi:hypothetical protein